MAKKTAQPKPPKKNPAAQALAKLRWKGSTAKQRSQFMQRVNQLAWQRGRAPSTGRPRDPRRCPCGAMTAARAAKRKHRCVAAA